MAKFGSVEMFRVLPEFLDLWSSDCDEIFVSLHDTEQLSSEWGVPVDALMSQVEFCGDMEGGVI